MLSFSISVYDVQKWSWGISICLAWLYEQLSDRHKWFVSPCITKQKKKNNWEFLFGQEMYLFDQWCLLLVKGRGSNSIYSEIPDKIQTIHLGNILMEEKERLMVILIIFPTIFSTSLLIILIKAVWTETNHTILNLFCSWSHEQLAVYRKKFSWRKVELSSLIKLIASGNKKLRCEFCHFISEHTCS